MPRRSVVRPGLRNLVLAGIVAGCGAQTGCSGSSSLVADDWSGGIPRGEPAVVTMENLSYDPPRTLGLVSDDHPAAHGRDAEVRRSGIKRVPPDRMDTLLEALEDRGFVAASAPLPEFQRADPRTVLRRLTITIGPTRRAFTLPRGPSREVADRFNEQAIAVQAMFNEIVDFRQDVGSRDPEYFYDVARALFGPTPAPREPSEKDGR